MIERFPDLATPRSCRVMMLANREAKNFNHEYIGTEHLLLGLLEEGSGVGCWVLKSFDLELDEVREAIKRLVKPGPRPTTADHLPLTPRAKKVIEYAIEEMETLQHGHVGTEHLLLGLLREQDGVAAQVLMNLNLRLENLRARVLEILAKEMGKKKTMEESLVRIADALETLVGFTREKLW